MTTAAAPGTAPMRTLWIAETFAGTIQGEGPSAGTPAIFIRTSGCNLECRWCDTPYTWDRARFDIRPSGPAAASPNWPPGPLTYPEPLAVLTGGEPLMQQRALIPLARALAGIGKRVEIETNGTYPPRPS